MPADVHVVWKATIADSQDASRGGGGGGGGATQRAPQSMQSVPKAQMLYSEPEPPSSQSLSDE